MLNFHTCQVKSNLENIEHQSLTTSFIRLKRRKKNILTKLKRDSIPFKENLLRLRLTTCPGIHIFVARFKFGSKLKHFFFVFFLLKIIRNIKICFECMFDIKINSQKHKPM